MPAPQWMSAEDAWSEAPEKALEILGVGTTNRKSKSLTTSHRAAYILSRIRTHRRMLMDMMRRAHAAHYKRPVFEENEEGKLVQVGDEPEVLSDEDLLTRYSGLRAWHEGHQEVVDHNVSVGGFSIHATSGLREEQGKPRPESSAGSERARERTGNDRW